MDLIGYRRHGHSEVDDPTVTQPRRYAKVKDHPPLYKLYAEKLGADITAEVTALQNQFSEDQRKAAQHDSQNADKTVFIMKRLHKLPEYWDPYTGGPHDPNDNPRTGVDAAEIGSLTGNADTRAGRLPRPPQGRQTAGAAPGDGCRQEADRLRLRRAAGLCFPAKEPARPFG